MDKETAIAVWAPLERMTFEFVEEPAVKGAPTVELPVFALRLDAAIDRSTYERTFRVFAQVTAGIAKEGVGEYVIELLERAKEMGAEITFENGGIALT